MIVASPRTKTTSPVMRCKESQASSFALNPGQDWQVRQRTERPYGQSPGVDSGLALAVGGLKALISGPL
jgi:hypothetical protein